MDTRRDTMVLPDYDIDTSFDTTTFIQEIESRPAIWDSSCNEYSNRLLKGQCWNELIEKYGPNLSKIEKREFGALLKKKYKNLRACFTRELRRQTGVSDDRRKSEYVYFQKLQFLEPVVCHRDSDHLNRADDDQRCEPDKQRSDHEKESDISEDETNHKRRRINKNKRIRETDPLSEVVQKRDEPETTIHDEDEDRLFLLSLLKSLKSVPQSKKMSVKIKIMSVLDEATTTQEICVSQQSIKIDFD